MRTQERRLSAGLDYTGVERRGVSAESGILKKLNPFARNREDKTDAEVDQDGLPAVGRAKGNNKLINMLGLVVILTVGIALSIAANSDKSKPIKKSKNQPEQVANTLPPLLIPTAPEPIAYAPSPTDPAGPPSAPDAAPIPFASKPTTGRQSTPNGRPVQSWQDRKMGGAALVTSASGGPAGASEPVAIQGQAPASEDSGPTVPHQDASATGGRGELAAKLEATSMKGASATLLPDRNYVLAKGASLDCVLETALDTTVAGMTTCHLTRDIYSDNGQVVLLDRGTQLVGEYQGGIRQGQARIFVLWTRAKTPNGVIVNLNSPGTDALGRSGLEGWVDTHFLDRFGAALMISLLKDSVAFMIARETSKGNGQNTLILGNTISDSDKLAEKALEASVNIPPTLLKNQGDHIQVLLARDLDFSKVYALQSAP